MCGIAGVWDRRGHPPDVERVAGEMAATLEHRGPDGHGTWSEPTGALTLAHRRLAILDLSEAGRQPMVSGSGRYVITFNGEIYNYRELRQRLEGARFRTGTDTEVLLGALDEWGFPGVLDRLEGMFAFAAWDRRHRCLLLARDRLGKKPLYYFQEPGFLLFGSELKALCAHPRFPRRLDYSSLQLYLRYHYVPSPAAIYEGTRKLGPGECAVIEEQDRGPGVLEVARYWDPPLGGDTSTGGEADPDDAVAAVEELLRDAVRSRLVSDVSLGALLSGGIDSSLVCALMQEASSTPIRTYTIGFDQKDYDEADHARAIAHHLGTDHTELYVQPEDCLGVIPGLAGIYDEPFGDSSQVPTILVSQMARRSVTVAVAGDGGDELFGGYERYRWAQQIWRWIGWAPSPVRRRVANGLRLLSPAGWDRLMRVAQPFVPQKMEMSLYGDKAHKLAGILEHGGRDGLYQQLVSFWSDPRLLLADEHVGREGELDDPVRGWQRSLEESGMSDFAARMMLLDLRTYLPEDILVKVDRASMATSLEIRAPLLDHRLVELAFDLPTDLRIRDGIAKWPLRRILQRYVPRELTDRPKAGFAVPIGTWLRGPLREWAEDLLSESSLRREGIFQPELVRRTWREHLEGRRDWKYHLWGLLMFRAWSDRWRPI